MKRVIGRTESQLLDILTMKGDKVTTKELIYSVNKDREVKVTKGSINRALNSLAHKGLVNKFIQILTYKANDIHICERERNDLDKVVELTDGTKRVVCKQCYKFNKNRDRVKNVLVFGSHEMKIVRVLYNNINISFDAKDLLYTIYGHDDTRTTDYGMLRRSLNSLLKKQIIKISNSCKYNRWRRTSLCLCHYDFQRKIVPIIIDDKKLLLCEKCGLIILPDHR